MYYHVMAANELLSSFRKRLEQIVRGTKGNQTLNPAHNHNSSVTRTSTAANGKDYQASNNTQQLFQRKRKAELRRVSKLSATAVEVKLPTKVLDQYFPGVPRCCCDGITAGVVRNTLQMFGDPVPVTVLHLAPSTLVSLCPDPTTSQAVVIGNNPEAAACL
jgi:hypothetical protein